MKNIHVLSTDKPSRLYLNTQEYIFENEYSLSTDECQNKHIYITSDEEIKEGHYGLIGNEVMSYHQMHKKWGMPQGLKIILTTDQDLIKDGVQAIDDEFLEWFVKNPSCEFVEVYKHKGINFKKMGIPYKIILPKEEPKQDLEKEMFELEQELDIPSHLRWHNSKPKQETTLEEFIKKQLSLGKYQDQESAIRHSIELGAKWQQEQICNHNYNLISEQGHRVIKCSKCNHTQPI